MAPAEGSLKEKGPTDPRLLSGRFGAPRPAATYPKILVGAFSLLCFKFFCNFTQPSLSWYMSSVNALKPLADVCEVGTGWSIKAMQTHREAALVVIVHSSHHSATTVPIKPCLENHGEKAQACKSTYTDWPQSA